ncbi:hypothetical protein GUJ93_ZPchr0011g28389 [Zizania palustris]|uniref:Uncharacterized protein n=1 Tax=Zizania palustris TaxID=103762 RepID=A0A8J5WLN4_ZIZPA|nr:hypothetical protein GUJ93_ZPchr0011g28389 [Zizania palustris]
MDWRRAGSPTYGRRRSTAGMYSAPASPAHPLGPGPGSSPVHPVAARNKARAAAALAQAMAARPAARSAAGGEDSYDDDDDPGVDAQQAFPPAAAAAAAGATNGMHDGVRSTLNVAGYGVRIAGGGVKDKYFGFALPKLWPLELL